MSEAKISALVVTKDRRSFIERCLYCLCKTTEPGEIIIYIWDNASEDDTADYLATLKQWPYIFPMRSKTNIGTEARQRMLPLVHTPYIVTLDDDIWINTPGWAKGFIDIFEGDPKLGAINFGGWIDERCRMGISWQGVDYNKFDKPMFRFDTLIDPTLGNLNPPDEKHERNMKRINGHWILPGNTEIPFTFTGAHALWRTELIRDYVWKSHAGLMSDMAGEWKDWIIAKGYYVAVSIEFICYHATGPWWHIPDGEKAWRTKSQQSPVIYNRSEKLQWSWYEQAKAWSGWGSGIPDIEDLLE